MPSEKDNSPTGSVQMSTPTKQGSSASSNVKTSGRSAKSKRGNGSMRKFLDEDGELDAEDVMVVGKLLAKLGFFKVEDLRILGEAFFETMMPDTPPVVVYQTFVSRLRHPLWQNQRLNRLCLSHAKTTLGTAGIGRRSA